MKKLLILIILALAFTFIKGQGRLPNETFTGNLKTEAYDSGARGSFYGFHFRHNYSDTTDVNNTAPILKTIPGFVVLANDTLRKRNSTATKWDIVGSGSGGGGSGTVTSISGLSPLFSVANPTTTPTFSLLNVSPYKLFGRASGTGVPSYLSLDTNFITGFSTYVRPLLSAGAGISYNSTTGAITNTNPSADTSFFQNALIGDTAFVPLSSNSYLFKSDVWGYGLLSANNSDTTKGAKVDTANSITSRLQAQHLIDSLAATISGGGSQTPWLSNINGANYGLDSVGWLRVGVSGGIITENEAFYSEQPQNASYYGSVDVTITGNQALDVEGNLTLAELNITNAGSNFVRNTNSPDLLVTPGDTYVFSMDIKQGTLSSGYYSVYDVTHSANIIAPTLFSIPAGLATRFTSASFVIPAGCTEIYIYPARDVPSTGTYFVGRLQVAHVGNAYIQTTTAQAPPSGSGGYLTAISTDSVTANIGLHGAPDATFNTTEYGSVQFTSDSFYLPNLPSGVGNKVLSFNTSTGKVTYADTTGIPTLQQVLTAGNNATVDIHLLDGVNPLISLINDGGEGRISAFDATGAATVEMIGGSGVIETVGNLAGVSYPKTLGDGILLASNALSGARQWTLPDSSGRVALVPYTTKIQSGSTSDTSTYKILVTDPATAIVKYANWNKGSVPLSGITAATATNSINNGANQQTWNWNSTTGIGLQLATSTTAGVDVNHRMLDISMTGANAASNVRSYGIFVNNSHTGTGASDYGIFITGTSGITSSIGVSSSITGTNTTNTAGEFTASNATTNIAGWFSATGGTNRYAIIVPSSGGSVGIGTSTPTALLNLGGQSGTAGTAPIKFTSGTVMTTPEAGALEYNSGLLMLDSSNSQRDTIATRKWARNNISGGGGSSLAIGSTITSATAGSVLFAGTGGTLMQKNSDFFYDSTNKRLGIGTASPSDFLDIEGANSSGATIKGSQPMLTLNATSNDPQITLTRAGNSSNMYVNSSTQLIIQGYNEVKVQQSGTTGFGIFSYVGGSFNSAFSIGSISNPTSTLQSYGSFALNIVSTAVDYTATAYDKNILISVTGKTVTLPTAVGIQGREYTIKLTVSGSGTIATTSSQTIDGSTTYSLASQYKYVTVVSDNANWNVIANN